MKNDNKKTFTTMSAEEHKKWNEEMFKKHYTEKQYYHPNPIIRYTENKRVKLTIDFLNPQKNNRILSVGCGEGYLLNKLKDGFIWGIDLSEEAIKKALTKNKLSKNINLRVADGSQLPFPDNFFDKVECSETIEHTLNPLKIVEEIIRVTKNEALIVFTYPNETLINKIKKILVKTGLFHFFLKDIPRVQKWHLHHFDSEVFDLLIKNKLIIKERSSVPFAWLPVRYVVKCKKINSK